MKINFSEDHTRSVYLARKVKGKKEKEKSVSGITNALSVTFLFETFIFKLLLVPEKHASAQLKTDGVGTIDQYFRAQFAYFPAAGPETGIGCAEL